MTFVDEHDVCGGGFHIRDDVRGKDHDAFARQVGEQVAEADTLLGVETDCRFVHDKQLRIVEQSLRDPHALFHAARIASQRTLGGILEIDQQEQFINAPLRWIWNPAP